MINEPMDRFALVLMSVRGDVFKVILCPAGMDVDTTIADTFEKYGQDLFRVGIVEVDTIDDLMEAVRNLNG